MYIHTYMYMAVRYTARTLVIDSDIRQIDSYMLVTVLTIYNATCLKHMVSFNNQTALQTIYTCLSIMS